MMMWFEFCCMIVDGVEVGMIKDVGDDLDVMYGVLIFVCVVCVVVFGVCFYVGLGVGMVMCVGLMLLVGELVINLVLC